MPESIKILEWDSEFFGFRVAKILLPAFFRESLEEAIHTLKKNGVLLAYWNVDQLKAVEIEAVKAAGATDLGRKYTYEKQISPDGGSNEMDESISRYPKAEPDEALLALAISSGAYSRFRRDPQVPAQKFEELYKFWIKNSVSRKICDEVFVCQAPGGTAGMVTAGREMEFGKIGLIAVDANFRGQGVGGRLLARAEAWFRAQGLKKTRVVTQGENQAAVRLYEKNGFRLVKSENTFHFWL